MKTITPAELSRLCQSISIAGIHRVSARTITDALNAAADTIAAREEALDHIHGIVTEKEAKGDDLELGSTSFKSVKRWAGGELQVVTASMRAEEQSKRAHAWKTVATTLAEAADTIRKDSALAYHGDRDDCPTCIAMNGIDAALGEFTRLDSTESTFPGTEEPEHPLRLIEGLVLRLALQMDIKRFDKVATPEQQRTVASELQSRVQRFLRAHSSPIADFTEAMWPKTDGLTCPNDTNGDGNCHHQTCRTCHPENFPHPVEGVNTDMQGRPITAQPIRTRQMGAVAIASDGERSAIGKDEEAARDAVRDMQKPPAPTPIEIDEADPFATLPAALSVPEGKLVLNCDLAGKINRLREQAQQRGLNVTKHYDRAIDSQVWTFSEPEKPEQTKGVLRASPLRCEIGDFLSFGYFGIGDGTPRTARGKTFTAAKNPAGEGHVWMRTA